MPDVFLDEVGPYHLSITTSADWTVSSGGMPNGDNYVTGDGTIAATLNTEGDAFPFGDGTAWSVEFWLYYTTARTATEMVICNAVGGSDSAFAWYVNFNPTEQVEMALYNTGGTGYLVGAMGVGGLGGTALATSTWHHVVFIKETGAVLKGWLDNAGPYTLDSSATGSPRTPDSTYRVYLGTAGGGASDINTPTSGLRIAKVAIYNRELTSAEVSEHYLAMVSA